MKHVLLVLSAAVLFLSLAAPTAVRADGGIPPTCDPNQVCKP